MKRFEGRVALITAAAAGLGEAGARRIASEGGRVTIWDRDAQALEAARRKAADDGLELEIDTIDMLDRDAIEAGVARLVAVS